MMAVRYPNSHARLWVGALALLVAGISGHVVTPNGPRATGATVGLSNSAEHKPRSNTAEQAGRGYRPATTPFDRPADGPRNYTTGPFFRARDHATLYHGPGRRMPEPTNIETVVIGYFGPDDPKHPRFGQMWLAAQMAIEEANAAGGYRGKPFTLVPAWSKDPWGTGIAQLAKMVFADKVWAIIGGVDGPSTHLAEQICVKARLALISPGCTDKTVNLTNVPWMFSCLPGDHLQAPVLAKEIARSTKAQPFVVVSTDDHDSRLFAAELLQAFKEHRLAPTFHFQWDKDPSVIGALVSCVTTTDAQTIVILAGPLDSGQLTTAIRASGFEGRFFGGPAMGHHAFPGVAEEEAGRVVFPLLFDATGARPFAREFERRHNQQPDYLAAAAYDAARLTTVAINKAGLNRARIGDAVRALSPWKGVSGTITWDAVGANTRDVPLGTITGGYPAPLAPCEVPRAPDGLTSR